MSSWAPTPARNTTRPSRSASPSSTKPPSKNSLTSSSFPPRLHGRSKPPERRPRSSSPSHRDALIFHRRASLLERRLGWEADAAQQIIEARVGAQGVPLRVHFK